MIKLSYNKVNWMIRIFDHFQLTKDGECEVIDQKMIDYANEQGYGDLIDALLGYEVCCFVDGTHKHDGQMVEYTFNLESPSGVETVFETEMCLMVGWNYHKDLVIR